MALTPEERLLQQRSKPLFTTDSTSSAIASEEANLANQRKTILAAIERAAQAESPEATTEPQFDFNQPVSGESSQIVESGVQQGSVLPGKVQITQAFGNYNPGLEPNKSGRNWGVDFGVKEGTPIALPAGEWEVVQAYNQAKGKGRVGNRENSGYGNSVLVRNARTGEVMRFSHLSGVNVQPGKIYKGGTVIGASGATGNVTGPHLDLEYKNAQGQFQDITRSPYAKQVFGMGGGGSTSGEGGGFNVKKIASKVGEMYQKAFPSAPLNQFNNVMGMAQQGVTAQTMTPEQKQSMLDSSMGFAMGSTSPVRRLPAQVNLIEKGLASEATPAMQAISKLYETHSQVVGKNATKWITKNIPSELDRINTMLADLKGLL